MESQDINMELPNVTDNFSLEHLCCVDDSMIIMTLLITFILGTLWIMDRTSWQTPILFYKHTSFTDYVVEKVPRLSMPYKSTFWLSHNRHIHTITATYWSHFIRMKTRRQYVKLKDGGMVAIDWTTPDMPDQDDARPTLIVVPGIEGSIQMASHVSRIASGHGYRTVVFNKRGHGGSYLITPKLQSFGDPADFKQVIELIHNMYPKSKLMAMSFSAGGGVLLSYLGEVGVKCLLAAAVFISPGFEPLEQSMNLHWLYENAMVNGLKNIFRQHSHVLSSHINMDVVLNAKSLIELDESVYCKFYNNKNVKEYWRENDPMRNQSNVTVPALFVCSLDDPVLSAKFIPYDVISEHSDWIMVRVDKGGHCGFREGICAEPWAETVALEYFNAVLKYENK